MINIDYIFTQKGNNQFQYCTVPEMLILVSLLNCVHIVIYIIQNPATIQTLINRYEQHLIVVYTAPGIVNIV